MGGTADRRQGDVWSRANAAETQPGYVTYLSREPEDRPDEIRAAIGAIVRCFGVTEIPEVRVIKVYHHGYAYYNMTAVAETLGTLPGLSTEVIFRSIGYQDDEGGGEKPGLRSTALVRLLPGLPRLLRHLGRQPARAAEVVPVAQRLIARVRREELPRSAGELEALVKEIQARAAEVLNVHITTTLATFALFGLLQQLCNTAEPGVEHALTVGLDAMSSKELGLEIWKIAEAARRSEAVAKLLLAREPDLLGRLEAMPEGAEVRAAFARFVDAVGDRTSEEMDLSVPRWEETPEVVFAMAASYLESGIDPHRVFADQRRARIAAAARVEKKLSPPLRPILRALLAQTQQFVVLRENLRTVWMKCLSAERRAYLAHAAELVRGGLLEQKEDIFHLKKTEVSRAMAGGLDAATAARLVAERRREKELCERLHMPDVVRGAPPPLEDLLRPSFPDLRQKLLSGMGVSPGVITGRARILHSANAAARIEQGDILVATTTDPGWTPLFAMARGLVMERGGLLSHGVIVAREYGLPAVVAVRDATRLIPDGRRITIDGVRGEVHILDG